MANDKPGLRKTFKTKTPYSGKLHYEGMSDAQIRKMISDAKAWLEKLKKDRPLRAAPKRPKPKRPMIPKR